MCGLQLFYFFLSFLKINVLQVCRLTKTMTKNGLQHRIRLVCAGFCVWVQALAVPVRWVLYICSAMDFLKDIFINLLSDSIWAVGGFLFAKTLFFKKSFLSSIRVLALKKTFSANLMVHSSNPKKNLKSN